MSAACCTEGTNPGLLLQKPILRCYVNYVKLKQKHTENTGKTQNMCE